MIALLSMGAAGIISLFLSYSEFKIRKTKSGVFLLGLGLMMIGYAYWFANDVFTFTWIPS